MIAASTLTLLSEGGARPCPRRPTVVSRGVDSDGTYFVGLDQPATGVFVCGRKSISVTLQPGETSREIDFTVDHWHGWGR